MSGKVNKCIITFGMHLLTQKMHQLIFPLIDLIHICSYISDFAFGADLVEVNRENSRKLFNLFVKGRYVGIENLSDFSLE